MKLTDSNKFNKFDILQPVTGSPLCKRKKCFGLYTGYTFRMDKPKKFLLQFEILEDDIFQEKFDIICID